MSGRYSDSVAYAYDIQGNRYLVSQEYSYAGGCGCYHDTIQIKEKLYDIEDGDDYFETKGTYLPFAHVNDYMSYFTSTPTETLQTILREAELTDIKISCFLILETRSVNAGPYSATCYRITEEGASEYEYDFRKEDLGNDLDAIFNTLLAKHEVING